MARTLALLSCAALAHALRLDTPGGGIEKLHNLLTQRAVQTQLEHYRNARAGVAANWLLGFHKHEHFRPGSMGEAKFHGIKEPSRRCSRSRA